jgi:hypothetical protein
MASSSRSALSAWLTRHTFTLGCTALCAGMVLHATSRACASFEHATLQRVNSSAWPTYVDRPAALARTSRTISPYLSPLDPDPRPISEIERMLRPIQPMMTMSCES